MVRARTFVFWKVCVLQVCWWVSLSLANTFVPRRTCWFVHNAWAFWNTSPLLECKVGFVFKRVITHHRVINCRKCFLNSRWRWRDIDPRHGRVKFQQLFDSAAWSWTSCSVRNILLPLQGTFQNRVWRKCMENYCSTTYCALIFSKSSCMWELLIA